jgi:hypothetical protein
MHRGSMLATLSAVACAGAVAMASPVQAAGASYAQAGQGMSPNQAAQPAPNQAAPPAVTHPDLSDSTVHKVGVALRHVTQIRQDYANRENANMALNDRQALAQREEAASVKAVEDQGLSVDQYNQVLRMAMADEGLKSRLLTEAQQAQ